MDKEKLIKPILTPISKEETIDRINRENQEKHIVNVIEERAGDDYPVSEYAKEKQPKRPYFKVSRNDYGKPFFFYKPANEDGRFSCWMPVDEEFEQAFNELQSKVDDVVRDKNYELDIKQGEISAMEVYIEELKQKLEQAEKQSKH